MDSTIISRSQKTSVMVPSIETVFSYPERAKHRSYATAATTAVRSDAAALSYPITSNDLATTLR